MYLINVILWITVKIWRDHYKSPTEIKNRLFWVISFFCNAVSEEINDGYKHIFCHIFNTKVNL